MLKPYEALKDYLTGDIGKVIYVLADGEHGICENAPEGCIWTECPGLNKFQVSASLFHYLERSTGRRLEDLDTVIRECVRDGDVEGFLDDMIDAIGRYWGVYTRRGRN